MCKCVVSIRDADWRTRLKNFDAVFAPGAAQAEAAPRPTPTPAAVETDLGKENPSATPLVVPDCDIPQFLTQEEFTKECPNPQATFTIAINGQNFMCSCMDKKVWLSTMNKTRIPGINSPNAKPVFLYAGGSWISDHAKARSVRVLFLSKETMTQMNAKHDEAADFIAKDVNQDKGLEFRLESQEDMVPWQWVL